MCGIAGIISLNHLLVSRDRIKKMTDTLAHRGPDGEGLWINAGRNVVLGHRRLSIIDLSENAAQPMHLLPGVSPSAATNDIRYTITYNGEIYNYIELRETLNGKGYHFRTQSDTEIVLAAYDYWKKDCLLQFDGMFSFAIWDSKEKKMFAARDRFGEKPFFYYINKEQFVFASEMKALWTAGIKKKTDEKMLLNYITLGHVKNANDTEQTFFENIYSLPPAHFLQIDFSDFKPHIHAYWDINKEQTVQFTETRAIEKFTELFTRSVKRRLRSDVVVGTCLSGGLDSSAIAATIRQLLNKNEEQTTFSAVFPGFIKDESAYIKTIVQKFGLKNFQFVPTAEGLIYDFQTLCYHQEEPFGSSGIYAQFKVFELAKQHQVKVLLDGQGADETLGGYTKYIPWYLQQLIARSKFGELEKEISLFQKKKISFKWGYKNYLAAFFPKHASIQLERNEYNQIIRHPDINPGLITSLRGREWEGINKPINSKLNDILYFNTCKMGLEELLRFADRNSMAHSSEVRLPFLNHELVEFIFSLPANFKIHEGWTKWLLRKSVNEKLPSEIVWRTDKIGFETPQHQWMQNKTLLEFIHESKRKLVNSRILKPAVLDEKVVPLNAHDKDNFDWRYLCAAQII